MSDLFKFYVLYKMNFKNILMKYLLKMLHLLDVLRYTALFLIHVNISVTYMINRLCDPFAFLSENSLYCSVTLGL